MDADLTRAIIEKVAPQFNIDVVTTGTAGLAQLQEFIYDIVLLDNRLPDMNGLEVLAQLTSQGRYPPVVLITSSGDDEIAAMALRSGAVDYVSKSDSNYLDTLPELLHKLVLRHRGRYLSDSSGAQRMQHILYVEPNVMDVELTRNHFKFFAPHLKLLSVTDSEEAFALLTPEHEFDLILTDLRLPGMDALEFIREAQRRGIESPFVVITGKGDEATAVAILHLGVYDYLVKRENYLMQLPHAIDHALHRFHLNQTTRELSAELTILNSSIERTIKTHTVELQNEITTLKQMGQVLLEHERDLQEAQTISNMGSYVIDLVNNTWRSSTNLNHILGIQDHPQKSGLGWIESVHPAHRESIQKILHEALVAMHIVEANFNILRIRDGMERLIKCRGKIELGSDGKPSRMVGVMQDITEFAHAAGDPI